MNAVKLKINEQLSQKLSILSKKPDVVGYSGFTYIAIRSGKHSSSTALAHGMDFEKLLCIPEFW